VPPARRFLLAMPRASCRWRLGTATVRSTNRSPPTRFCRPGMTRTPGSQEQEFSGRKRKDAQMRASRQSPFRPECECLEDRAVPATHLSASFSGGVLRIEGTNHADLILVAENHDRIWVAHSTIRVHSHQQASIEASAVKKIEILGLGGNDTI